MTSPDALILAAAEPIAMASSAWQRNGVCWGRTSEFIEPVYCIDTGAFAWAVPRWDEGFR